MPENPTPTDLAPELTQEEWAYAVDFRTRAGHITTDTRQELVLPSDTLWRRLDLTFRLAGRGGPGRASRCAVDARSQPA